MSGGRSRRALALALLLVLGGPAACGGPPDATLERVVLVTIDTLRADHVGCYGAESAETPALDALAADGVRFANAISPAALTLPSHATLLTGLDPPQHGVRHNGLFRLPADVPTLAERMREADFATAAFVSAFVLDDRFGLDRGFDHYDARLGVARSSGGPGAVAERRGDHTVDAALAWLAEAPPRFFLWVHLYDPHAEYEPPPPFAERFSGRPYDGEIAFADAQLARLRAGIEARFGSGTLWWVAADHGESLGEHGEATHSYGVYEATQHVPMLAAGPGLPRGRVVENVVALADVAPSLLELLGIPALAGATGESLIAAARGDGAPARRAAWVETLATQLDMGWSPLLGVRTGRHKYIRAPEPELYDLAADPRERVNRAGEEPDLAAELDRLVEARAEGRPVVLNLRPDAEERARLEALGYLRGPAPVPTGAAAETLGRVGGVDPKDGLAEAAKLDELMLLLAQRRGREALAAYDEIRSPGFTMLLIGAEAAIQAGDLARAERDARRALAQLEHADAWMAIGNVQYLSGDFAEARRSFERARALDPEKSTPLMALGLLAEREGGRDEARRYYEAARAVPIPSSAAYWRAAALALEDGRRDEARELLAHVPQPDLREPAAAHRLAQAERRAGRPELARTRVDGALQEYPWSVPLWLLKADLHDEAGDLEGALAARREALRQDSERAETENAIAWTLARLGRELPEAEERIESALERLGRLPALIDTLACVRAAQGRYAEALALADEGLERASETARVDLLFRRAEALAGLGRRDAAAEALALAQREASGAGPDPVSSSWQESERRVRRLLDGDA